MEARRRLHRLRHPGELRGWPGAAELQRLGRLAVEITHVGRQRLVASVEGAWQSSAEDTKVLFWRVDRHVRIDACQEIEAAGVVAMPMGDHDEVQLGDIDT